MSTVGYEVVKLLGKPENRICADCSALLDNKTEVYASLQYGVWICSNCADVHRRIVTQSSFLKKASEKWAAQELEIMQKAKSNSGINSSFEKYIPKEWTKIKPSATVSERERWIKAKYFSNYFMFPQAMSNMPKAKITEITRRQKRIEKITQYPNRLVDYFLVLGPNNPIPNQSTAASPKAIDQIEFVVDVLDSYPTRNSHEDTPIPELIGPMIFPNGLKLSTTDHPPYLFTYVLTDINRVKLFGCTMIIYELVDPTTLKQLLGNTPVAPSSTSTDVNEDDNRSLEVYYMPRALTILSHYGFFTLFSKFLTQLYHMLLSHTSKLPIERYIINFVTELPLPPYGKVEVVYSMPQLQLNITRPGLNQFPMIDFSFQPLFTCLHANHILFLFQCLCQERTLCFFSRHIALLTPIQEALLTFLFPFHWQGAYIPILPFHMIEMLQAPIPLIVGLWLTSDTIDVVSVENQSPDIVYIDIDNDILYYDGLKSNSIGHTTVISFGAEDQRTFSAVNNHNHHTNAVMTDALLAAAAGEERDTLANASTTAVHRSSLSPLSSNPHYSMASTNTSSLPPANISKFQLLLPKSKLSKLKSKLEEFGSVIYHTQKQFLFHASTHVFPQNEHLLPIHDYLTEQDMITSYSTTAVGSGSGRDDKKFGIRKGNDTTSSSSSGLFSSTLKSMKNTFISSGSSGNNSNGNSAQSGKHHTDTVSGHGNSHKNTVSTGSTSTTSAGPAAPFRHAAACTLVAHSLSTYHPTAATTGTVKTGPLCNIFDSQNNIGMVPVPIQAASVSSTSSTTSSSTLLPPIPPPTSNSSVTSPGGNVGKAPQQQAAVMKEFNVKEIREAFLRFFVACFIDYENYFIVYPNHHNEGDAGTSHGKKKAEDEHEKDIYDYDKYCQEVQDDFLIEMIRSQLYHSYIHDKYDTMIALGNSAAGTEKRGGGGGIVFPTNPNQCEVTFFDEHILAKKNRSKLTLSKQLTPFLSLEQYYYSEICLVPTPSIVNVLPTSSLHDQSRRMNGLFPLLNILVHGNYPIRLPKVWPQDEGILSKGGGSAYRNSRLIAQDNGSGGGNGNGSGRIRRPSTSDLMMSSPRSSTHGTSTRQYDFMVDQLYLLLSHHNHYYRQYQMSHLSMKKQTTLNKLGSGSGEDTLEDVIANRGKSVRQHWILPELARPPTNTTGSTGSTKLLLSPDGGETTEEETNNYLLEQEFFAYFKSRNEFILHAIVEIQSYYRRYPVYHAYRRIRHAIITIQVYYTQIYLKAKRKRLTQYIHHILTIQRLFRGMRARIQYTRMRACIIRIQTQVRTYAQYKKYHSIRHGLIRIQSRIRSYVTQQHYQQVIWVYNLAMIRHVIVLWCAEYTSLYYRSLYWMYVIVPHIQDGIKVEEGSAGEGKTLLNTAKEILSMLTVSQIPHEQHSLIIGGQPGLSWSDIPVRLPFQPYKQTTITAQQHVPKATTPSYRVKKHVPYHFFGLLRIECQRLYTSLCYDHSSSPWYTNTTGNMLPPPSAGTQHSFITQWRAMMSQKHVQSLSNILFPVTTNTTTTGTTNTTTAATTGTTTTTKRVNIDEVKTRILHYDTLLHTMYQPVTQPNHVLYPSLGKKYLSFAAQSIAQRQLLYTISQAVEELPPPSTTTTTTITTNTTNTTSTTTTVSNRSTSSQMDYPYYFTVWNITTRKRRKRKVSHYLWCVLDSVDILHTSAEYVLSLIAMHHHAPMPVPPPTSTNTSTSTLISGNSGRNQPNIIGEEYLRIENYVTIPDWYQAQYLRYHQTDSLAVIHACLHTIQQLMRLQRQHNIQQPQQQQHEKKKQDKQGTSKHAHSTKVVVAVVKR